MDQTSASILRGILILPTLFLISILSHHLSKHGIKYPLTVILWNVIIFDALIMLIQVPTTIALRLGPTFLHGEACYALGPIIIFLRLCSNIAIILLALDRKRAIQGTISDEWNTWTLQRIKRLLITAYLTAGLFSLCLYIPFVSKFFDKFHHSCAGGSDSHVGLFTLRLMLLNLIPGLAILAILYSTHISRNSINPLSDSMHNIRQSPTFFSQNPRLGSHAAKTNGVALLVSVGFYVLYSILELIGLIWQSLATSSFFGNLHDIAHCLLIPTRSVILISHSQTVYSWCTGTFYTCLSETTRSCFQGNLTYWCTRYGRRNPICETAQKKSGIEDKNARKTSTIFSLDVSSAKPLESSTGRSQEIHSSGTRGMEEDEENRLIEQNLWNRIQKSRDETSSRTQRTVEDGRGGRSMRKSSSEGGDKALLALRTKRAKDFQISSREGMSAPRGTAAGGDLGVASGIIAPRQVLAVALQPSSVSLREQVVRTPTVGICTTGAWVGQAIPSDQAGIYLQGASLIPSTVPAQVLCEVSGLSSRS